MGRNLSLFLFVLVVCFGVGEGVARYMGYFELEIRANKVIRHGSNVGELSKVASDIDWFKDVHYFDDNKIIQMDGQSFSKEKEAGEKRLLLLGDSATFGQGVTRKQSFARIVESKLPSNWRTINAGLVGLDNVDELWLLENKLIQLNPDVIVWQVFMANDLNYNISDLNRDFLENNELLNLLQRSALFKLSYVWSRVLISKFDNSKTVDQRGLRFQHYPEGEFALYHSKNPSSLETRVYKVFASIAKKFQRLANRVDAKLYVIIVPTRSAVINDLSILPDMPDTKKLFGKSDEYYLNELDYKRPSRKIKELLGKEGIPSFDPLYGNITEEFFLEGDDHPGVEAHKLYAAKILEFVRLQ